MENKAINEVVNNSNSILQVNALNQFYGESHTLWDLDLSVIEGKCTVLMGRNGVGKTTLCNALWVYKRAEKGRLFLIIKRFRIK